MRDDLQRTVIIPLAASLVTGALVGLVVLTVAAWRGWSATWAGISATLAALLSWFAWAGRMAAILEHRLAPGLPKAPMTNHAQTLDLRIHEECGAFLEGTFLYRLPGGEHALEALAGLVLSGQSLTTSQVCASGLLGRADWEELRDRFVYAGLLRWRGGNRAHGCEVTPRGLAVFRRMAAPHTPPIQTTPNAAQE